MSDTSQSTGSIAPYDQVLAEGAKLASKLLDTFCDFYEPRRKIKNAKADYKAAKLATRARAEALIEGARAEVEASRIRLAARNRLIHEEVRRQENIEATIDEALAFPESKVSDRPVDPNWRGRFLTACQDVSEPEIRKLFAKLLADEVSEPGSFSKRALSILEQFTPDDARLLEKLRSRVWRIGPRGIGSSAFVPKLVTHGQNFLSTDELAILDELGILQVSLDGTRILAGSGRVLVYGERSYQVISERSLGIPAILVTVPGEQLLNLCTFKADEQFLFESLGYFRSPIVGAELHEKVEPAQK